MIKGGVRNFSGSFSKLIAHHPARINALKKNEMRITRENYWKLSVIGKIFHFFKKKRRFFYIILAGLVYRYGPKLHSKWSKWRYEKGLKNARVLLGHYKPEAIQYQSADNAVVYKIEGLSSASVDRLINVFMEIEDAMPDGCSRQLIINALMKMQAIEEKGANDFLDNSGFISERKRMLCSCSLQEYLELIRDIVQDYEDEEDFISILEETMREEKEGFMERLNRYLDLKANIYDGSSEIPRDQMPHPVKP